LFFCTDSSDSEDVSNPLSTTTSWEFISKASSWSDLRCLRIDPPEQLQPDRNHTSPRHQQVNYHLRSKVTSSNGSVRKLIHDVNTSSRSQTYSESSKNSCGPHSQIDARTSLCSESNTSAFAPTLKNYPAVTVNHQLRITSNGGSPKHLEDLSTRVDSFSRSIESSRYNVPFQCDIYSMPVDSIAPSASSHEPGRPIAAPRRSRVRDSRAIQTNHRSHNNPCLTRDKKSYSVSQPFIQIEVSGSSRSSLQLQNQGKLEQKLNGSDDATVNVLPRMKFESGVDEGKSTNEAICERNNNLPSCSSVNPAGSIKKPTRRSRSVEINNILEDDDQKNSSQTGIGPKQSTLEVSNEKPEKRRLGHSILNLFKRNKSRNRCETLMTSSACLASEVEK
jgi:hypothetical protein